MSASAYTKYDDEMNTNNKRSKNSNGAKHSKGDNKDWYREPWLWFILAPLILVVFSTSVLIFFAVSAGDDIVSDDYYKEGRLLAQEFTSEEYAKSLGLSGDIRFDWLTGELILQMNQSTAFDVVTVLISHPAKSKYDQTLTLRKVTSKLLRVDLDAELSGRWYLRVSAYKAASDLPEDVSSKANTPLLEVWRLNGEIDFNSADTIVLK